MIEEKLGAHSKLNFLLPFPLIPFLSTQPSLIISFFMAINVSKIPSDSEASVSKKYVETSVLIWDLTLRELLDVLHY